MDFSDPQKMVAGFQISVVVTGLKFLKFPSATNLNKLMFYHLIIKSLLINCYSVYCNST